MRQQSQQNLTLRKWNVRIPVIGDHEPILVEDRFKPANHFAPGKFPLAGQIPHDHALVKCPPVRIRRSVRFIKRMLMGQHHELNPILIFGKRFHLECAVLRRLNAENMPLPALQRNCPHSVRSGYRVVRDNVQTTSKRNFSGDSVDHLTMCPRGSGSVTNPSGDKWTGRSWFPVLSEMLMDAESV